MVGLMPFKGMPGIRRELDRLFDRFGDLEGWGDFASLGDWAPSMDVSESKDAFVVKMEVPGMEPGDIQVSMQESMLTVKGEKKQEKEEKTDNYYVAERSFGSFARSIRLPDTVDEGKVEAKFDKGVLKITAAKKPEAVKAERKIEIKKT